MNAFIKRINALGYRTTLWVNKKELKFLNQILKNKIKKVHPFVNIEAKNFMAWAFTFITVRAPDGILLNSLTLKIKLIN